MRDVTLDDGTTFTLDEARLLASSHERFHHGLGMTDCEWVLHKDPTASACARNVALLIAIWKAEGR